MTTARSVSILVLLLVLSIPSRGRGASQTVDVGEGVSFDLPPGLIEQTGVQAPVLRSWNGATDRVSVLAVAVRAPDASASSAMIKEFQDWPGVGRSMVAGMGDSLSKAMGTQLRVACNYTGTPLSRDAGRYLMKVAVEVTCPTSPEPTVLRAQALAILTRSSEVLVRVDAMKGAYPVGERIASEIWASIKVAPEQRIAAAVAPSEAESPTRAAPVAGGAGFHLTDYGLIRPAAIFGKLVGSLIAAFLIGGLLTALLLALRVPPLPAVVAAQILIIVLAMWGESHDGVWEFDWLVRGVPGVAAAFVLLPRARKRWQKKQLPASAAPPPAAP